MKSKKKIILNLNKYKVSRLNFILGGDDPTDDTTTLTQTQETDSKIIIKCPKPDDNSKNGGMACPTQDSKDRDRC